jgi:hypothetical protein
VAKVKKRAGLTGVRNAKPGKPAKGKKIAPARKGPPPVKAAKAARGEKPGKPERAAKSGKRPVADEPVGRVVVRELDPQQKCGEGTSVQFLYRVDHTVDGHRTAHLVFYDPHGWYCEHGRTCPAVAHAKKHNGQFARVS